ncbi:hypothetical protein [Acinetobacter higginsii]|uniref:hypothetical protein n=1 Tax=Acinetobacter higginsii TaxID=70347 RepID=UPI001F4AD5A3|nr:hypothetical protein [Acinetobacter higginsii]MCH7340318.1 hypothetical protein [Acinetobacter higginsii]
MSKPQFNKENSELFFGEKILNLLNSDLISPGDISNILKKKGILPPNSLKTNTVPLLTSLLLSPMEFDDLINRVVNREQTPKIRRIKYSLKTEDETWTEKATEINFSDTIREIEKEFPSIKFLTKPSVITEDFGKKISINYSIERKDLSKDFLLQELNFEASISMEKVNDSIKVKATSKYSSNETSAINKKLLSHFAKDLKNKNILEKEEPEKILFGDFNNEERITFMNRLSESLNEKFSLGRIIDLLITIDKDVPNFPKDKEIYWLHKVINNMRIDGEELNQLLIITNSHYHKHFIISDINICYDYKIKANEGSVKVNFCFSGSSRKNILDHELTFEITHVKYNNKVNEQSRKEIEKILHIYIGDLIERQYDFIVQQRALSKSAEINQTGKVDIQDNLKTEITAELTSGEQISLL